MCLHLSPTSTGATPGIFIMETIMEHVAKSLGKDPTAVKILNLYKKGQVRRSPASSNQFTFMHVIVDVIKDSKLPT